MNFRPRLVALDIDGTLVDESNVVTPAASAMVRRVVEAGVPVVMATGRSWMSALTVIEQLALGHTEHVCSNGAVTASYPPFELVDVITFDPRPVVARIREHLPGALLAVEVVGQGYQVTSEFPTGELHGSIDVVPLEDMINRDVTRVIVRDPEASEAEFVALAENLGLEGVSYSIGYTAWLDIAPPDVTKAHGLERVCARLGVDRRDVLALGDGRNDVQMLEWAGRGVAMGGSPPEVIALADDLTASVGDDGIVSELERWFGAPGDPGPREAAVGRTAPGWGAG